MTKKCIIIRLYLQANRIHEPICKLCYTVENPVPHILFRCVNLQEIRDELWANLEIPLPFRQSIENLNYVDRTVFLLRAFNVKYVKEWKPLYEAIATFIFKMTCVYDTNVKCINN